MAAKPETPDEMDLDTHPDARIFVLENTIDDKSNSAIREVLSTPAQTVEGMLTKVRIAMREVLCDGPKRLANQGTPEEGYAYAADNAFHPEGIVASLWADLTRLHKKEWERAHPPPAA